MDAEFAFGRRFCCFQAETLFLLLVFSLQAREFERGIGNAWPTRFGTLHFVRDFVAVTRLYLEWKGFFIQVLYGYIGTNDWECRYD